MADPFTESILTFAKLSASVRECTDAWAALLDMWNAYGNANLVFPIYPNNRVKHLAKHAKKYRVRKKNQRRALYI